MTVYSILVCGAIFYLGYRLQHVKAKAKIAESKLEKQRGAQMVSIIKYEGSENVCVWKHPAKTVTTGSLLMVKPPFEAVIAQHGTPVARYPSNSAIAINARDLSRPYFTTDPDEDYETECEIFFINTEYRIKLDWHTGDEFPCRVRKDEGECSIQLFGHAEFKIANTLRFAFEICSANPPVGIQEDAEAALGKEFDRIDCPVIARELTRIINNGDYDLYTFRHSPFFILLELKSCLAEKLIYCPDIGLELVDLSIDCVVNKDSEFDDIEQIMYEQAYFMQKHNEALPAHIVQEVNSIIAKEFPPEKYMLGMCHAIWHRAKELYAERGYTWYSPQDIHPLCMFD